MICCFLPTDLQLISILELIDFGLHALDQCVLGSSAREKLQCSSSLAAVVHDRVLAGQLIMSCSCCECSILQVGNLRGRGLRDLKSARRSIFETASSNMFMTMRAIMRWHHESDVWACSSVSVSRLSDQL